MELTFEEKVYESIKMVQEMKIYSYAENRKFLKRLSFEMINKQFLQKQDSSMEIIVVDGAIGSGKSTILHNYLKINKIDNLVYMNPDLTIVDAIRKVKFSIAYINAKRVMWEKIDEFVKMKKPFIIEMVIAKNEKIQFLRKCKEIGYGIKGIYVGTESEVINIERARRRCIEGGYSVPATKIIDRYHKNLNNLNQLIQLSDELFVINNSLDRAELIAYKFLDNYWECEKIPKWYKMMKDMEEQFRIWE